VNSSAGWGLAEEATSILLAGDPTVCRTASRSRNSDECPKLYVLPVSQTKLAETSECCQPVLTTTAPAAARRYIRFQIIALHSKPLC